MKVLVRVIESWKRFNDGVMIRMKAFFFVYDLRLNQYHIRFFIRMQMVKIMTVFFLLLSFFLILLSQPK